jgi:hypothetical protein
MSTSAVRQLAESSAFQALTTYTERFEPFRVLGIHNKELVHSRLLAHMLRTTSPHGLGNRFLRGFLQVLSEPGPRVNLFSGTALDAVILRDACAAHVHSQVYRELNYIDIVVVFPALKLVIGIENKIYAGEQKKQLTRYQETLSDRFSGFKQALVFLTPNKRNPETANLFSQVPVYCMDYSSIASVLRCCRSATGIPHETDVFIKQFIEHIECNMIGGTQGRESCWQLFSEHESAYREMFDQYHYCLNRKVEDTFKHLADRLINDPAFGLESGQLQVEHIKELRGKELFYDLHVRLQHWPKGVWVKIYKHTWFGVFPFICMDDLASHGVAFKLTTAVASWKGLRYVCAQQDLDEGRRVLREGDQFTDEHVEIALGLAATYAQLINHELRKDEK